MDISERTFQANFRVNGSTFLYFFSFFCLITDSKTSLQLTDKNVLISNFVYFFLSSSFGLSPAKIMDIFAVRHIKT